MKYINKTIEINADNENYHKGYIIELSKLELKTILDSLEIASHELHGYPYELLIETKGKLDKIKVISEKGIINEEL